MTKTIVKSPTPRPLFEPDELYGPDEIATRLKSTERQVRRWIDERRFCAGGVVQLPRGRRVFGFALNEFVAERARSFKA